MDENKARFRANQLLDGAKGNITPELLWEGSAGVTGGDDLKSPILQHIPDGEQLHFLFRDSKCPTVTYPHGGTSAIFDAPTNQKDVTYDHTEAYYTAITETQILWITGLHRSESTSEEIKDIVSDEIIGHPLSKVTVSDVSEGVTKTSMILTHDDGRRFKFWGSKGDWGDMQAAKPHIESKGSE